MNMLLSMDSPIIFMLRRLAIYIASLLAFQLQLAGQLTWNKSIDFHNELNHSEAAFEQYNGNIVVSVLTYPDSISYQGALLSLNSNGIVEWSKGIEDASHGFFMRGAYESFQNQIWSLGVVNQDSGVTYSPIIVSSDSLGKELWRKTYNYNPYDVMFMDDLNRLNDSTLIIFFKGEKLENSIYSNQYGFSLFDIEGNEKYRQWLSTNYRINLLHDAEPFPEGGYMLSVFESNQGNGIPFEYPLTIKRLDDTFGIIWQKTLPLEEAPGGRFSFDQNNNIYMTWDEDPSSPNTGSPWGSPSIISFTKNGEFRWKNTFDDNPRNRGLGNIITTKDGQIVSTGLDEPGFPPLMWGWVVSLDTSGTLLWDRKYTIDGISPNFGGFFGSLFESTDNHIVVNGYIHDKYPLDKFAARDNVWVAKLDLNGCIENEPCEDYSILTKLKDFSYPEDELNFRISPNPVQNILHIEFSDSKERLITIYTSAGSLLYSDLTNEKDASINVSNFSPQLNFIKIIDRRDHKISIKKFIKI
jgi:hypothetical protein